jgi:hypothetical protein
MVRRSASPAGAWPGWRRRTGGCHLVVWGCVQTPHPVTQRFEGCHSLTRLERAPFHMVCIDAGRLAVQGLAVVWLPAPHWTCICNHYDSHRFYCQGWSVVSGLPAGLAALKRAGVGLRGSRVRWRAGHPRAAPPQLWLKSPLVWQPCFTVPPLSGTHHVR